jgi:hypothetical protein
MGKARSGPRGLRHDPTPAADAEALDTEPASRAERELRKAPVDCRAAAEQLARDWSTDEQALGTLKAFSAACEAGDGPECQAVDTRFSKPRYLGASPVPHLPPAALHEQPNGAWKTTCQFTREGTVTACRVDEENARAEPTILDWIRQGPWSPATFDGRPFGCEYELEVRWSRSHR